MPELPDITAYIRALEPRVLDQTIQEARVASPFVVRTADPPMAALNGQRVTGVTRLGKRIVLGTDDELFLVIHLMIAGRLKWRTCGASIKGKLALAALDFATGTLLLTEAATKKRASIHLLRGRDSLEAHHAPGLEPLQCSAEEFTGALSRENHTLKRALTDPRLFSGIGNAYSDEILHAACLSPVQLTQKLTDEQAEKLFRATRSVLELWCARLSAEAQTQFPAHVTAFRDGMSVHGRYGKPCPVCGTPVQRIASAENECNYCPGCQTGGKLLADRALSRLLKRDWPRTLQEMEEHRAARRIP